MKILDKFWKHFDACYYSNIISNLDLITWDYQDILPRVQIYGISIIPELCACASYDN